MRPLAVQNVLREAGAAAAAAARQYASRAGGAFGRVKDNLVGSVGAAGSHVPSAQDVATALRRGALSPAARIDRPFAGTSGLIIGPR